MSVPTCIQRHVAGQDEHLGDVAGSAVIAGADRVARAARLALEREVGDVGEHLADRRRRRRVDDERPLARSRRARRRGRRPSIGPAAERVEDLGDPRTASACRGRPP